MTRKQVHETDTNHPSHGERGESAEDASFLARYLPTDFPRPAVAVDLAIFSVIDAELCALLIRRGEPPFRGSYALPGGFVRVGPDQAHQGEDLEAAALRELAEETGLSPSEVYLEQLGAFGAAGRDPRMRVITVAYYALVRPDLVPLVRAGGDAAAAEWKQVTRLPNEELAFDHGMILQRALDRIRERIERAELAQSLVPKTFTVPELRHVMSIVRGVAQDPGNFRRRFQRLLEDGVIERAPGKRITASKPAQVYRFVRGT